MSEELGLQDYKIGARGNVFSFLMPWDDIMMEMNELTTDDELAAAPHPINTPRTPSPSGSSILVLKLVWHFRTHRH